MRCYVTALLLVAKKFTGGAKAILCLSLAVSLCGVMLVPFFVVGKFLTTSYKDSWGLTLWMILWFTLSWTPGFMHMFRRTDDLYRAGYFRP